MKIAQHPPHVAPEKRRLSFADLGAALLVLGFLGLGVYAAIGDAVEYRRQRTAVAEFRTRHPQAPDAAPYDPEPRRRWTREAGGGAALVFLVLAALRRTRRSTVGHELRIRWARAPTPKTSLNQARTPARTIVAAPARRRVAAPGTLAAERLSLIVRSDHEARFEPRVG